MSKNFDECFYKEDNDSDKVSIHSIVSENCKKFLEFLF